MSPPGGRAFHDAGIGDDKIDRREAIEVLDPSRQRRAVAHVDRGHRDFGPQRAAFACRIRKPLLVAAEQRETAALAGIAARQRFAYPARSTGDEDRSPHVTPASDLKAGNFQREHALRDFRQLRHRRIDRRFDFVLGMHGGEEETQPRRFRRHRRV